jgi:pyruvate dehydrogenase E2 component (dihydrolipoamide acetyltransferase)
MAGEITLPELGENVEGGTVVELHVGVGDVVKAGQALVEVEAGKGTVEVPAPSPGKIAAVLIKKGDEVQTGQSLFRVEFSEVGQSSDGNQHSTEAPPSFTSAATAKTARAAKSSTTAQDSPPDRNKNTEAADSADKPSRAPAEKDTERQSVPPLPDARPARLVPASPATRLLARELGVDISHVKGSARSGRITPDDVKAYVRQLAAGRSAGRGVGVSVPRLPDFSKWGPIDRQPLSSIRQEIVKQMTLAWSVIPHVTQHDVADVTDLDAFRKAQPEEGPKITVTAFALKACAIALQQFPQVNSALDLANYQLILKRFCHIGVAVDTEHGLLVPVIRDVDRKSIYQLARELTEVAERARNRKISGEELSGGTFTVTNLGGIGGTGFTPIVNHPEVAILGLSRGRLQPVVHQGQIMPRLMLPLSLSYDHRVIDGADAARFTRRIAGMLENPLEMLLHA